MNSKEQRAMLTDAGITMMKTFEIVKPEKYMNLDQICNVIESMVPHESLPDRVLRMSRRAAGWRGRPELLTKKGRIVGGSELKGRSSGKLRPFRTF